jgi:hypothetical protein
MRFAYCTLQNPNQSFEFVYGGQLVAHPTFRFWVFDFHPLSNAGNRAAAANRGRLFFGYFLFGEAKESD